MIDDDTRRDLWLFAGLTLALSWVPLLALGALGLDRGTSTGRVLFVVGTSGPTLAALGLWLAGRRRPRSLRPAATVVRWLPAAIALGALPGVLGVLSAPLLGGPAPDPTAPGRFVADVGGLGVAVVGLLVAGPLAEEFGWRGYAQPRLRRALTPAATAAVLGTAWAVWHLPLFWLPGTSQHEMGLVSPATALWALTMLPLSYAAWFVSERLGGGVAAAVALHAAANASTTLLEPRSTAAATVTAASAFGVALLIGRTGVDARPRRLYGSLHE